MNMHKKFEVRIALPVPEIIGGTQKIGQSLHVPTISFLQKFYWAFIRMNPVHVPGSGQI